jgi:hypothetical protein
MRKEKTFKIGDKSFTAKELTVKQITQITSGFNEAATVNDVDMMFPDRIPSQTVCMSLEITENELLDYAPSEIEEMITTVEEVNPTFANLMQRLAKVGRQILAQKSDALSAS